MNHIIKILYLLSILCLFESLFILLKTIFKTFFRTHVLKISYKIKGLNTTINGYSGASISTSSACMSKASLKACDIILYLLNSETNELIATIQEFPCIVGRCNSANVIIKDDNFIGRKHILFTKQKNTIFIENLGSKNRPFINNVPLYSKFIVNNGDMIKIGKTEIIIFIVKK